MLHTDVKDLYWSAFFPLRPQFKGGEVYFGSQIQRFQFMVNWLLGRNIEEGHDGVKLSHSLLPG